MHGKELSTQCSDTILSVQEQHISLGAGFTVFHLMEIKPFSSIIEPKLSDHGMYG